MMQQDGWELGDDGRTLRRRPDARAEDDGGEEEQNGSKGTKEEVRYEDMDPERTYVEAGYARDLERENRELAERNRQLSTLGGELRAQAEGLRKREAERRALVARLEDELAKAAWSEREQRDRADRACLEAAVAEAARAAHDAWLELAGDLMRLTIHTLRVPN